MGSSLNCKLCLSDTDNTNNELFTGHSNNINDNDNDNVHFNKLQNLLTKLKQQPATITSFSPNNFTALFNNSTHNFESILNDCNEQLDELQSTPPFTSSNTQHTKLPTFAVEYPNINEKEYYDCSININNGAIDGVGSFVDDKGNAYRGQFKNNVFDGVGFYATKYGDYYYGEWKDGLYHGKGEYVKANGCTYKGEFQYGVKHGNGEETYPNKTYYSGEFVNGKKNGYGKLEFKDGSYYVGEFKEDEFDGNGEYQFSDGRFYKGKFAKGKMLGTPEQRGNGVKKEMTLGEQDIVNFK